MITGVLVALPEELRTLSKTKIKQGECFSMSDNTLVTLAGSGSDNASKAAQSLLNHGAQQLISWGCAGALAPHLKSGDLIIPALILTQDNTQLATDASWSKLIINSLQPVIKCYDGMLVESAAIISKAQDKAELFKQTQALAVDMESAAVARTAQQANIPFIAVRSIIDPADLDLPNAINHAMTDKGIVSIPKLLIYLCSHPQELPSLINTALYFNKARKTLTSVACQLPQTTQVP